VASPDGGPPFLEGFIADITERKRMTQALEEKEYLLSESQRMGHIGTWSFELASGAVRWTRETYRLYGVCPDAFAPSAETLLDRLHPDDRGRMREWMRSALANERPGNLEFRTVLPDGSIRVLSGRGELVFGEGGRPVRLVGTVQDITEQKQAELALRELSRKDEEALRVARMGHWEFDVATGAFLFNDQYYTLHGITAREAGGYRMTADEFARRYVHPEDAPLIFENVRKAVATDDPNFQLQGEARILRSDGNVRWVNVWFRAEKDAAGRTVKLYGVNQDITERRNAEEALRRLNERLETLVALRTEDLTHTVNRLQQLTWELSQTEDRERKRIADILHDDVQQTLAAARFHLNLLSTGTRSPEESREILGQVKQMLKEAIERARSLSHELSPVLYQVDLTETLRWLARHMHEKHGLTVQVEAHGSVDSSSECVKALLYKVAQELLFNIVKHSGIKEAVIRVRRMGRYICLVVIDRGRGFETQGLEKTAGFGLLGIRERIQLLGGRMKIKSRPGMGCRLLIAIPDEGPSAAATQAG
jgi:PAS domain S-box-containing protein